MSFDCHSGHRQTISYFLLDSLPLDLSLIGDGTLFLGFFEISGSVDFFILLHLCLHDLVIVAFLRNHWSLHIVLLLLSFSSTILDVFVLTEVVLAFRRHKTTTSQPSLMILVFPVCDFFTFKKFLLGSESAQHSIFVSFVLRLFDQLLQSLNTGKLRIFSLACSYFGCNISLAFVLLAEGLRILNLVAVDSLVELVSSWIVFFLVSHLFSCFCKYVCFSFLVKQCLLLEKMLFYYK